MTGPSARLARFVSGFGRDAGRLDGVARRFKASLSESSPSRFAIFSATYSSRLFCGVLVASNGA